MEEDFLPDLFAVLNETGLDPRLLELELARGLLMKRAESTTSVLRTLRESGVKIAIDDFGTGFSSLSYMVDLQGTDGKLSDRSSVRSPRAPATAVISIAHSLNLRVVAEGVETRTKIVSHTVLPEPSPAGPRPGSRRPAEPAQASGSSLARAVARNTGETHRNPSVPRHAAPFLVPAIGTN